MESPVPGVYHFGPDVPRRSSRIGQEVRSVVDLGLGHGPWVKAPCPVATHLGRVTHSRGRVSSAARGSGSVRRVTSVIVALVAALFAWGNVTPPAAAALGDEWLKCIVVTNANLIGSDYTFRIKNGCDTDPGSGLEPLQYGLELSFFSYSSGSTYFPDRISGRSVTVYVGNLSPGTYSYPTVRFKFASTSSSNQAILRLPPFTIGEAPSSSLVPPLQRARRLRSPYQRPPARVSEQHRIPSRSSAGLQRRFGSIGPRSRITTPTKSSCTRQREGTPPIASTSDHAPSSRSHRPWCPTRKRLRRQPFRWLREANNADRRCTRSFPQTGTTTGTGTTPTGQCRNDFSPSRFPGTTPLTILKRTSKVVVYSWQGDPRVDNYKVRLLRPGGDMFGSVYDLGKTTVFRVIPARTQGARTSVFNLSASHCQQSWPEAAVVGSFLKKPSKPT